MRLRKARAGVTLAEMMIAMAVILIGMSGVASSLYFGFNSSDHGEKIAQATQYARTLIEVAVGRNYNDSLNIEASTGLPSATSGMNDSAAQKPRPIDAAPFDANAFPPSHLIADAAGNTHSNLSQFTRKISLVRVGAVGSDEQYMARMTVTVYWTEKGVEKSVTTTAIVPQSSLPTT